MDSNTSEIAIDGSPLLRIYKDGRVERLLGTETVSPGLDPQTNVESKDVLYSQETGQSVRLYIPKTAIGSTQKLPLLVYYHGGGFCIETAFSPTYHYYLNSLVAEANIVVVSVDYRRAPEHPIPVPYHDSWDALKWVASHCGGNNGDPEQWLSSYVDFDRVFLSGDSAGANIAHHTAMKMSKENPDGVSIDLVGIVLVHPYFCGTEPVGDEVKNPNARAKMEEIWRLASPTSSGSDDPWINPIDNQNLASLGCGKVLVCVAEKDILKHRGIYYCEKLKKSGWGGEVELMEAPGEDHVFHLFNSNCENALIKLKKVAAFMNHITRTRL